MSEVLIPVPKSYADLFEIISSVCELDANSGTLYLKDDPGAMETWRTTRRNFVLKRGYTPDEFSRLTQIVDEDVIKMRFELDQITPNDFDN